ncbi:hypothetical protein, partial [Brucella intermedia]|uniref:hypothetical protein n=1 Tax=Brucella intermedia TaxID=94625 RepID=UPI001AF001DC
RGGRGPVGGKKEITSWLLSVSAFFCADNGFVGSLASKPLNLNVKSVKFLTAVMGRNRKRAGLSPSLFA